MYYLAAAKGTLGGFVAGDEVIPAQHQQGLFESDLTVDGLLGLGFLLIAEQDDLAQTFSGAHVDAQALMIFNAFGGSRADFQKRIESLRSQQQFLMTNHLAALNGSAFGTGQIHGDPLTPTGALDGLTVHLQAAHAKEMVAGETTHLRTDANLAAERRAGDDDAMALEHEGSIHRQTKVTAWRGVASGL
jgi:hypothetical protein